MALTDPALEVDGGGTKGVATGREFIVLVTALMATTALGIDLMLPAFPDIRQQFGMPADSTQVMTLTIAMTFLFAIMTTYLSGSEIILEDVYGYGSWFPLFFAGVAVLLAINSLNNARMVQRVGITRLVRRASIIGVVSSTALLVVSLMNGGVPNFWVFTAILCIVIPTVQGLTPNCNTAAMTPLPHVAGTASAIIATITSAGGAILGGVASGAFDGTVRPFALYVFGYLGAATVLIWWGTSTRRRR